MPHDVLIVGAGPAGAVAAHCLARAGLKVRVLERARFPRDKLCGDTVNPGTMALLERLGIAADVRRVSRPVTGMIVSGPRGAAVTADYPPGLAGASLRRSALDQLLLAHAQQAGADVEEGIEVVAPVIAADGRVAGVTIRGPGRRTVTLHARLVIAADGRGSRLASALGVARWSSTKRWAFGTCFAGVIGTTDRGEMHVRDGGYIGVAPLPDDTVNVCVVRDFSRRRPTPGTAFSQVVANVLRMEPGLASRFAGATQISEVVALGPLGVDVAGAGAPGLLLAGDAAGFVDPMTGDGLRFAIRGGELAANAAIEELTSGVAAHVALTAARRREFSAKARFNRGIRWLTGSGAGMAAAERLATWWDAPFAPLVRIAGDCRLAQQLTAR